MRRLAVVAALALAACAAGCGRRKAPAAGRALPSGDGVFFADGFGSDPSETERLFARGGLTHLFLSVGRVGRGAASKGADAPEPPAAPFAGAPVVLVLSAGDDFAGQLAGAGAADLAAEAARRVQAVVAKRAAYGRVEGVHLDFPFRAADAERFASIAAAVRAAMPADLFLTCALNFAPGEKERPDVVSRLSAIDGFVASVYGEDAHADPAATEALGKPWWAGYAPGAVAVWTDAGGATQGRLSERYLAALTDTPAVTFSHDIALTGEVGADFVLQPTAPVEVGGTKLAAGDRISYRQPALSDLIARFGADLAGRRLVRGRLVTLDGSSDAERVFTLEALSDVLLGRPLLPDVRVTLSADAGAIRVSAENRATHTSLVSRTANWVEVDVPGGRLRDAQPGGFDRYEMFDAEGRPVTPGRASRVRFYETLVGPRERIAEAAILLRGKPPGDCCRHRLHLVSASGTELAGDWIGPPPKPTPAPKRAAPGKAKRRAA